LGRLEDNPENVKVINSLRGEKGCGWQRMAAVQTVKQEDEARINFLVGQLRQCGADVHAILGVSGGRCRNKVWRSVVK
jgi:hypothetical protein